MSKFVIVNKLPEDLRTDEYVVPAPNFMAEIKSAERKRPRTKMMTVNYLREVIANIGDKYAGEEFNALTSVNISPYRGVPCENDSQVHDIVVKVFEKDYPKMFDLFVEYYLKRRPHGTKLIYFNGSLSQASKFFEHGVDQIKEKDIPTYLGTKKKKVVGKPAVTDEEAKNGDVV